MKRDLKKLTAATLDVLVIGGGAHGATIAYHSAKAGYRVALVEKNDFCSATSASSLKILHGGLRYLQHLNIKRMRHSVLARREMMQMAPHLVQPLSCIMPAYGHGLRSRLAMQAALFLNDCISWDRNRDLPEEVCLPPGFTVSRQQCQDLIPDIGATGLNGAAIWHDALALDTERLIMTYLLEAADIGAMAANYTQATGITKDGEGLYCVSLKDTFTQQASTVTTRCIVNAAGPWIDSQFSITKTPGATPQKWSLALNLVSRKEIFTHHAVALEGNSAYDDKDAIFRRKKRLYFFVPWRGYTMIGTDYQESDASPDALQVRSEDIQNMLDDINTIYPRASLEYKDISFYHAGLLPMSAGEGHNIQLEKESLIKEYQDNGYPGIFSIKGVKYTTAPHIAHTLVHTLRQRFAPSKDAERPCNSRNNYRQTIDPDIEQHLAKRYGRNAAHAGSYLAASCNDDIWLDKTGGLLTAEVAYLLAEEMACKLSDIVLRRTGLGTAECPPRQVLEKIAGQMAEKLSWDEGRKKKEIEELLSRYAPLQLSQS